MAALDPDSAARLDELAARLEAIERRLGALERATPAGVERRAAADGRAASAREPAVAEPRPSAETLPVLGRTVLIIGGAFVLRAVTEAGILPPQAGAAAGVVYAALWLVVAYRTALAANRLSATAYGIASCLIAYPLLWETTVQFGFLGPAAAAVALVGFTAFGLGICWRVKLHGLAWCLTLAACATIVGLAVATHAMPLFCSTLLLLGLGTLWLGWSRDWTGLALVAAVPACGAVLLMSLITLIADPERVSGRFGPGTVVTLQIALVLVYVGSLILRTLTTRRDLSPGEIALGTAAAAVGLGGAIAVVRTTDVAGMALGLVALALGVAGYAASFTLIDRAAERRTNFVFYSTLAMGFLLIACEALFRGTPLALILSLAAVATAWVGGRWQRATLTMHGAVYAVAASASSDLLAAAVTALTAAALPALAAFGPAAWVALAAVLICTTFPVATHGRTWGHLSEWPKVVLIAAGVLGLAGVAVSAAAALVSSSAEGYDEGALAVVRTGALALGAILLAWIGRSARFSQATWLVYPALIAGGVKLLLGDFRVGRPATLVLSLALYGSALILAPRLARRGATAAGTAKSGSA